MEKIYKTMQGTGVINIVIGSVIITVVQEALKNGIQLI